MPVTEVAGQRGDVSDELPLPDDATPLALCRNIFERSIGPVPRDWVDHSIISTQSIRSISHPSQAIEGFGEVVRSFKGLAGCAVFAVGVQPILSHFGRLTGQCGKDATRPQPARGNTRRTRITLIRWPWRET
jgi:hypothetical protein